MRKVKKSKGKKFVYKKRNASDLKKRAEGNNQYDSFYKNGVEVYKIADDNSIRILPPTFDNAEHYGLDLWVHYGIGVDEGAYLCPEKMANEPCPVCETMRKALKSGDKEYANDLKPKLRVLVYMIDRDKEDDGPKVWSMPPTVDAEIASLCVQKRTGEILAIDDPYEGYDIDFERTGKGIKTKYKGIRIARNESQALDDEEALEETLDFLIDNPLDKILNIYSYDHINNVFNGVASEDEDEPLEEEYEEEPVKPKKKKRVVEEEPEEEYDENDYDEETTTSEEDDEVIEDEDEPLDEEPEEVEEEPKSKSSVRDRLRRKMKNRK